MKSKSGFTIVEIMVTVAIIATLASIVTLSFNRQLVETRDSARATNATLFAAALEKYYDKNDAYPSPRALVGTYSENTGDAVSTLLSIKDKSTLVMPNATSSTTNSIAAALGTDDVVAYVATSAAGSTNCQTVATGGCDGFTLTYKKESDNSVVTIESTHKGRAGDYQSPLEAPSQPTIAAVQSGTNIVATSSVPACVQSGVTAKYSFQTKVAAGAWSSWTAWQAGNTYTNSSNTDATLYSFQVMVRCDVGSNIGDASTVGGPATVTYYAMPATPATPTVTAGLSGANAQGVTGAVSCNYGTAQYQLEWRSNDGAWNIGWTWGSGLVANIGASDGVKYGFRSTARCVNGTQTATSGTSAEATYIDPIATPGAPTVSGATYAGKTWTWTAAACPAGTWASYANVFRIYTGAWTAGSWMNGGTATSATNPAATSQGLAYDIMVHQSCNSAYTVSSWSPDANGAYFWVPVTHVAVSHAGMKLLTGAYPSVILKSFTGNCAAGVSRYVALYAGYENSNVYLDYTGFVSATTNTIINIPSQAVVNYVEIQMKTRCQNASTGYNSDAGGVTMLPELYDIGNLHKMSATQYNISCVPDSPTMYCAAGFDSVGNSGTTNATAKACTVKASSYSYILDTNTKWSDRYNFGADNVCWTTP